MYLNNIFLFFKIYLFIFNINIQNIKKGEKYQIQTGSQQTLDRQVSVLLSSAKFLAQSH